MSYKVSFEIEGDSGKGVKAVDALLKKLEAVGASQAPAQLANRFERLRGVIGDTSNAVKAMKDNIAALTSHKGFSDLQTGLAAARSNALSAARAIRTMADSLNRVSARSIRQVATGAAAATTASNRAAIAAAQLAAANARAQTAQTGAATAAVRLAQAQARAAAAANTGAAAAGRWALAMRGVEAAVARVVIGMGKAAYFSGRGVMSAGGAINRFGVQGAGPIQGFGIAMRMGGIALGNQLSTLGSGGITGLAKMVPAILANVSEIGVRAASTIAGFAVKGVGLLAQGILNMASEIIGPLLGSVLGKFGSLVGQGLGFALKGVGSILTGITNLVGEAVSQIGNIFTGLAEIARGAFQGVINIAGEILGKLVDVASEVVSQVAGVLGTLGKMVLGGVAVIGGFALHDVLGADKGIAKVSVLLDTEMTTEQKRDLHLWARDVQRELATVTPQIAFDTLERAVSTGFQGNLPGAKGLATSAMKLAVAGQAPDEAPTAARVMAKAYSLFKDEFETAAGPGGDPFEVISDHIQALVNYGDLKLPDIVNRLGEILAKGKAVGASFEDIMVLLAQMSQSLGVEQTFTDVGHLLTDPLKFSDKAKDLLKGKGINLTEPNANETEKINAVKKKIAAAEKLAGGADALKDKKADIAAMRERASIRKKEIALEIQQLEIEKRGLKGGAKAAKQGRIDSLRHESKQMDLDIASDAKGIAGMGRASQGAKEDLKDLNKELAALERGVQKTKNPLELISQILKAGFSPGEMAVVFRNIRGLVGALATQSQDPQIAAQIEEGIRGKSKGSVATGVKRSQDNAADRFSLLWKAIKQPFTDTLTVMGGTLNNFLDSAIAGFQRLADWWQTAMSAPGAKSFIDNLSGKLKDIFGEGGKLFGGLFDDNKQANGITQFWDAMNSGLDKTWEIAGKVGTAFSTLYGWVSKLIDKTGAGAVLGGIGEAMGKAFSWMGETAGQLGKGKTTNLDDAVQGVKDAFDTVWAKGKEFYEWAAKKITETWDAGVKVATSIADWIDKAMTSVMNAAKYIAGLGIVAVLAKFAGGGVGGGGAAGGGGGGGVPPVIPAGRGGGGRLGLGLAIGLGGRAILGNGPGSTTTDYAGAGAIFGGLPGAAVGAGVGAISEIAGASSVPGGLSPSTMKYAEMSVNDLNDEADRLARTAGPKATAALVALNGALSVLEAKAGHLNFGSGLSPDQQQYRDISDRITGGPRGINARVADMSSQAKLRQTINDTIGAAPTTFTQPTLKPIAPFPVSNISPMGPSPLSTPFSLPDPKAFGDKLRMDQLGLNPDEIERQKMAAEGTAMAHAEAARLRAKYGSNTSKASPGTKTSEVPKPKLAPTSLLEGTGWTKEGDGSWHKKTRNIGSPFGIDVSVPWKKLRSAEKDPNFEGGRYERFTSRGKAAAQQQMEAQGVGGAKPGETSGAEALDKIDPKKLDSIENKLKEAFNKLGIAIPDIIKNQDQNADEITKVAGEGFKKAADADEKQRTRIKALEDAVDVLARAADSAGENGTADGSP